MSDFIYIENLKGSVFKKVPSMQKQYPKVRS